MSTNLNKCQIILWILLCTIFSCSKESNGTSIVNEQEETSIEIPKDTTNVIPNTETNLAGEVTFFNASKTYPGYVLVNDPKNAAVYVMNKNAEKLYSWELESGLGNDVFLLPNGKLLASLDGENSNIQLGGSGGRLQLIDAATNTVEWNFNYSTNDYVTHHDAEILPNGNVIALTWQRKDSLTASNAGSKMGIPVFPESIIEINPKTNEIVWEWSAWNHLVQDYAPSKENYGIISEHPELISLNYVQNDKGDIMHANGLAYDEDKDVIYISVNFFSEVWVIDHSTSMEEVKTHQGGNYNKGGDLLYRFGNPEAYENPLGERLFRNNHYPNLLQGVDSGKMLIYTNGGDLKQSTVYELQLPITFTLNANSNNEPNVTWSFTNPDLFSPKVSGAVRLPNGNTLITEGDFGFWEVTTTGEIVWQFKGDGFFWRGYSYDKESQEILSLISK